jgi:hypothetical protein
MAYADEIAAANRLTTREERFAARNAVRAKYGMEAETKTRGGLAGVYDRNKGLVQAALPTLAGILVPGAGALAGGVVGGLAKGLDRPGQGGIGLDLKQAGRGALAGAGLGQVGSYARTGLQNLMAPKADTLRPMTAPTGPSVGSVQTGMGTAGATTTPAAAAPVTGAAAGAAAGGGTSEAKPNALSSLFNALKKPEVLAPAAGAVADVFGSMQDRATKEAQVRLEEQQMRMENERRARLAELLMPLFQQQVTQYAGRR